MLLFFNIHKNRQVGIKFDQCFWPKSRQSKKKTPIFGLETLELENRDFSLIPNTLNNLFSYNRRIFLLLSWRLNVFPIRSIQVRSTHLNRFYAGIDSRPTYYYSIWNEFHSRLLNLRRDGFV